MRLRYFQWEALVLIGTGCTKQQLESRPGEMGLDVAYECLTVEEAIAHFNGEDEEDVPG